MIKYFFKQVIRNIVKHKAYFFINVAGLAVGIACAVLIMLWVQYELSYDRFNKNADRLYRVVFTNEQKEFHGYFQPGPLAKYLKDNFPEVDEATNYSQSQFKVSYDNQGFFCTGSVVHPSFFNMFSFNLEEGDRNALLNNPNSIVISRSLSQKLFGKASPVGKKIKLNDQSEVSITGVFADVPQNSHMQFDFVIPFSSAPAWMNMWDRKCVNTYVLLHSNASFDVINKKISGLMNQFNPSWKNILYLYPVTKSHLYEPGKTGTIIYVYLFSIFGILVLITACINFMNLSIAQSKKRMKEIGIKKAVGSSRNRLIMHYLNETILLSIISLLVAIAIVEVSLPYMNSILEVNIKMVYSPGMVLSLLSISVLTGLAAGIYPAFYLTSINPISILAGKSLDVGKRSATFFRNALIVAQFSFSIFTIICVAFINGQLKFIQSRNLGFNKDNILLISTRGELNRKVPLVKEELQKLSFVKDVTVSATNLTGFAGAGTGPIDWEGKKTSGILEVGFNYVDEDFAKTFQVGMSKGRFFSKDFPGDKEDAIVINEETAKEMNIANPVNKEIVTWFGKKGKIVGVIKDFNSQSLRDELAPLVFIPTTTANYLCVRLSSANIRDEINTVGNKIKEMVPDDPFDYTFLDKEIDSLYKTERKTGELAAIIAVLAVFISCLGLFGLVSFMSGQRTKEIGIRKVLGASVTSVLALLVKDFTRLILFANIISWPIAWYVMNKWLQNFVYKTELSIWIFVLAGTITLLIAVLTISVHAIKAAIANPVKSLKYE